MSSTMPEQIRPLRTIPGIAFLIAAIWYVVGTAILILVPIPGLSGLEILGAYVIHYIVTGSVVCLTTVATICLMFRQPNYGWLLIGQIPACLWFSGIWLILIDAL